ncbi:MAG: cbb3-type cytochrome c oxidase subunit II [Gammaproteobacteria bacterium]|nr:cbb3-type cytochrome c oxidase subunit II [Gammaproteobacteria bacterium]
MNSDHRILVAVAAFGFLFLSLIIAVLPAFEAQKTAPHADAAPFTELEARGRELYVKEGCATCHTQFVRDLPMDEPYGRGSVAEDYAREDPPLLGTQRTGPDLANVGERQPSDVWHLIHLYNPRAVVTTSVMPAYPWYFEEKSEAEPGDVIVPVPDEFKPAGKVVVSTEDADALVAYLKALKQHPIE